MDYFACFLRMENAKMYILLWSEPRPIPQLSKAPKELNQYMKGSNIFGAHRKLALLLAFSMRRKETKWSTVLCIDTAHVFWPGPFKDEWYWSVVNIWFAQYAAQFIVTNLAQNRSSMHNYKNYGSSWKKSINQFSLCSLCVIVTAFV